MKVFSKKTLCSAGFTLALATTGMGSASATTLELALVLDGSGSINAANWDLQLKGYKDVFASGTFFDNFVAPSKYDTLVVSAYQFGYGVTQEIGWTSITDNSSATDFGNLFTFSQVKGNTNTEGAILTAMGGSSIYDGLLNNGIASDKMVIDISTDGVPNYCVKGGAYDVSSTGISCSSSVADSHAIAAADYARSSDITVNAIGVGSVDVSFLTNLVNGTPDGFFLTASGFDTFGDTLKTKLGKEIIGVPEPSILFLFGAGLLGLGVVKRRKQMA